MILGITGISGVGKHEAAHFFKKRGWVVFDVDKMAHRLYRPYTYVWKALVKRFGEVILTKEDLVDRQKLRAIVFDSNNATVAKEALHDLNKIIHPEVRRKLEEKIHRHFRRKSNIVIVAALWEELGLFDVCDRVLLIKAHQDKAWVRIKKRDGIDEAMYKSYTSAQQEPEHPNFVVENNGHRKIFEQQLKKIESQLLNV